MPALLQRLDDPGFGWSPPVFDSENWGREAWRQPPTEAGEEVVLHEPGRIVPHSADDPIRGGTDCRSHCFKVVKPEYGNYTLVVSHGAGVERVGLGWRRVVVDGLAAMDSDARFRFLWMILDVHHNAERAAAEKTAAHYRKAFVEGRLKKRALPKQGKVKVWIEPERAEG